MHIIFINIGWFRELWLIQMNFWLLTWWIIQIIISFSEGNLNSSCIFWIHFHCSIGICGLLEIESISEVVFKLSGTHLWLRRNFILISEGINIRFEGSVLLCFLLCCSSISILFHKLWVSLKSNVITIAMIFLSFILQIGWLIGMDHLGNVIGILSQSHDHVDVTLVVCMVLCIIMSHTINIFHVNSSYKFKLCILSFIWSPEGNRLHTC